MERNILMMGKLQNKYLIYIKKEILQIVKFKILNLFNQKMKKSMKNF